MIHWTPWNHKNSFFSLDDPLSIIIKDHLTRESAFSRSLMTTLMTICQTFIDSKMTCTDYRQVQLLPKLFLISQKENQLACLASKPPADFYLLDSHCKTINSQLMIEAYWNLWAFDELHRTISRGVICCCKTFQTKKRNLIRNYDSQVLGNLAIVKCTLWQNYIFSPKIPKTSLTKNINKQLEMWTSNIRCNQIAKNYPYKIINIVL